MPLSVGNGPEIRLKTDRKTKPRGVSRHKVSTVILNGITRPRKRATLYFSRHPKL